ncbi:hypothetical protein ACQY0O_003800 [Thecaphora frezii]
MAAMLDPPQCPPSSAEAHAPEDLPDLSMDVSTASLVVRPSFEQLNATLFSRGYLRAPLNVAGLAPDSVDALADALHAIIAQRQDDLDVRSALTAKTRTLAASLERTKRFLNQEAQKCADAERRSEAAKAKILSLEHALQAEQTAHKATKEALNKSRRDLQLVKASALQHRASSDRNVARVRARIGDVTATALRSSVPDFRIVSSAFDEVLPGVSGSGKARMPTLAEEQVEELEKKRAELMDYNQALKRLATEAINAVRRADAELLDIVEAEDEDSQKRTPHGLRSSRSSFSFDLASSSSASSIGGKAKAPAGEAWLLGHGALFQRDLFPASQSFTTTAVAAAAAEAGAAMAISSSSRAVPAHPAIRALSAATGHLASHVQTLLDLRASRLVHEAEASKRAAVEAKEAAWQARLHSDVQADIENDGQFSVNRQTVLTGPGAAGGDAPLSRKQAWREEKRELERKLVDTVKRLAVAEQNVARRERELRKLEESEKRARRMVDEQQQQQQRSSSNNDSRSGEAGSSDAGASGSAAKEAAVQREKDEALAEKQRYAQLCEALERERQGLARARDKMRAKEAESRAMSAAFRSHAAAAPSANSEEGELAADASSRPAAAVRKTVSRLEAGDALASRSSAPRLPPVLEDVEASASASTSRGGDGTEIEDPAVEAKVDTINAQAAGAPETTEVAAVTPLSPTSAAESSLSLLPAATAAAAAVEAVPSSNPELDAIFGRGFLALSALAASSSATSLASADTKRSKPFRSNTTSPTSSAPTASAAGAKAKAPAEQESKSTNEVLSKLEKPPRRSSRLSSSSNASPSAGSSSLPPAATTTESIDAKTGASEAPSDACGMTSSSSSLSSSSSSSSRKRNAVDDPAETGRDRRKSRRISDRSTSKAEVEYVPPAGGGGLQTSASSSSSAEAKGSEARPSSKEKGGEREPPSASGTAHSKGEGEVEGETAKPQRRLSTRQRLEQAQTAAQRPPPLGPGETRRPSAPASAAAGSAASSGKPRVASNSNRPAAAEGKTEGKAEHRTASSRLLAPTTASSNRAAAATAATASGKGKAEREAKVFANATKRKETRERERQGVKGREREKEKIKSGPQAAMAAGGIETDEARRSNRMPRKS